MTTTTGVVVVVVVVALGVVGVEAFVDLEPPLTVGVELAFEPLDEVTLGVLEDVVVDLI